MANDAICKIHESGEIINDAFLIKYITLVLVLGYMNKDNYFYLTCY